MVIRAAKYMQKGCEVEEFLLDHSIKLQHVKGDTEIIVVTTIDGKKVTIAPSWGLVEDALFEVVDELSSKQRKWVKGPLEEWK